MEPSLLNDKAALIAIATALVAVIVELYRRVNNNTSLISKQLEECQQEHIRRDKQEEESRQKRDNQILDLTARLYKLEGQQNAIRDLAEQVIQIVTDISIQNTETTISKSHKK